MISSSHSTWVFLSSICHLSFQILWSWLNDRLSSCKIPKDLHFPLHNHVRKIPIWYTSFSHHSICSQLVWSAIDNISSQQPRSTACHSSSESMFHTHTICYLLQVEIPTNDYTLSIYTCVCVCVCFVFVFMCVRLCYISSICRLLLLLLMSLSDIRPAQRSLAGRLPVLVQ